MSVRRSNCRSTLRSATFVAAWLAMLALAAPTMAAAQTQPGGRERARAALTPEVFQQVDAMVATAAQSGLPTEPLWDKALEGAAKRVPAGRIAPVVSEYATRLGTARGALGAGQAPAALIAGADALRRGVPPEVLGRLGSPTERAPVALVVLADLVETGVPVDRALDVVREALTRRAADDEMLGLTGRVRAAMRQGQNAGAAAEAVRRQVRDGVRTPAGGDAARPPTTPTDPPPARDPGGTMVPRGR